MIRPFLMGAAMISLAGCVDGGAPRGVTQADLSGNLVPAHGDRPPEGPEGACWARDVTPAVIETELRQEMVTPNGLAADGTPIPASFRSVTTQKIVQDRREVWFRTPCDAEMTVAFIASLQRALKARGLYTAPVTGRMDDPTARAIRQYQAARGLDSPVLSLDAARDLGIAAADPATL